VTSTPQISIYTLDPNFASVTAYTVTVLTTEFYSKIVDTKTFQLTIQCTVASVSMINPIASFTYYYGDPTSNTPLPTYTAIPNCGNKPLSYSLQMQAGGTVPSAFSLNLATKMFVITQNVAIPYTVNYNLKLVVTETYQGITSNSACLWTVTVTCIRSLTLMTNPIPASTTYILDPNNLNTSALTLPTYSSSPAWCTASFSYDVKNTATSTCTPWITCNPTTVSNI